MLQGIINLQILMILLRDHTNYSVLDNKIGDIVKIETVGTAVGYYYKKLTIKILKITQLTTILLVVKMAQYNLKIHCMIILRIL